MKRKRKQARMLIGETTQKGGIATLLMHCLFNNDGSQTTWLHEHDPKLWKAADEFHQNTYVVIVVDDSTSPRRIVGGFIVKTSYDEAELGNAIGGLLSLIEELPKANPSLKFLSSRLRVPGTEPLTELEMERVFAIQHAKYSAQGRA